MSAGLWSTVCVWSWIFENYFQNFWIVYKVTDEWYIAWQRVVQRVITSDNEWQRATTCGTTSDNEWQRMTTSDKESQRVIQQLIQRVIQQVTTNDTTTDNEWQWMTTSGTIIKANKRNQKRVILVSEWNNICNV